MRITCQCTYTRARAFFIRQFNENKFAIRHLLNSIWLFLSVAASHHFDFLHCWANWLGVNSSPSFTAILVQTFWIKKIKKQKVRHQQVIDALDDINYIVTLILLNLWRILKCWRQSQCEKERCHHHRRIFYNVSFFSVYLLWVKWCGKTFTIKFICGLMKSNICFSAEKINEINARYSA